jgi:hypothetical protein
MAGRARLYWLSVSVNGVDEQCNRAVVRMRPPWSPNAGENIWVEGREEDG